MRKRAIVDGFGGFDNWEGNFRVRKRWYEDRHKRPSHTDEFLEREEVTKTRHRGKHHNSRWNG